MNETIIETIQRDSIISFPFLGDIHLNPPASFSIFGTTVYFYAVFIVLGFAAATVYCMRKADRFGFTEDDVLDSVLTLIPCSLIGARAYFVAFNWSYYKTCPEEIVMLWKGGIAIYGGIIAGIAALIILSKIKKKSAPALLDLIVFGLLLGQIIGRWGNFMNREAFGAQTDIFCRMGLTNTAGTTIYVHPTFLYESLWNLIGFIWMSDWAIRKNRRRYDGQLVLLYFLWYGLGRSWIEMLRTDSLYIPGTSIRVSSLLSVILAVCSLILLIINSKREHPPEKLFVNRIKISEAQLSE